MIGRSVVGVSAKSWVALPRGINRGRNRRVSMADLRALLDSLGYGDVRTHAQSRNALFTAEGAASTHERRIAAAIDAAMGLDVAVMVRTPTSSMPSSPGIRSQPAASTPSSCT